MCSMCYCRILDSWYELAWGNRGLPRRGSPKILCTIYVPMIPCECAVHHDSSSISLHRWCRNSKLESTCLKRSTFWECILCKKEALSKCPCFHMTPTRKTFRFVSCVRACMRWNARWKWGSNVSPCFVLFAFWPRETFSLPLWEMWIPASPRQTKWTQVSLSRAKWVQISPSESKWDQVSPSLPTIVLSNFS